MKRLLIIFVFTLISFVVAACQSQPQTIVFITNRTDLKNTLLKDLVTEFEAEYEQKGWKVRIETVTDYENVVTTRITGNNYGDVLLIPQTIEPKNLNRYFDSMGTVSELTTQGFRGISTKAYQGEVYGIPIGLTSSGILINTDLFQKAGVNPATLTTPQLFLEGMKTIQTYGLQNVTDFKAAFHTQTATGWGLTQWAASIIPAAGDPDYINYVLPWDQNAFWNQLENKPGQVGQIYDLLYQLITNEVVETSPTVDVWEESKIWFAQGKIGAMALGSWAITQFEDAAENVSVGRSSHIGYMPYPFTQEDNKMYAAIASDYAIGVAKNSKNKEIANTFARFLVEDFNYAAKTGNIPPKIDAEFPAKVQSFQDSGVIFVEETPALLNLEGALSLAERFAASSQTDEKRIALWDSTWISDFSATAFDVRDQKSNQTIKELLEAIQAKWNNGVLEVIKEFGQRPNQ
jgi:raffinose/stachyose/melibiose transport system substrate-binding protein